MNSISVIIPTYNRAPVLEETLRALASCVTAVASAEIIVVDNNSTDATVEVVRKFSRVMPLRYLHERKPGKNCALNRAVTECRLGDFVVFLDDDITVAPDAFVQILRAGCEFPDADVFGARIHVPVPMGTPPKWMELEWVRMFGFGWHDFGDKPLLYEGSVTPMGGCYWVRKRVFEKVPRFDESIGPRPRNRIMGSEVSHLMALRAHGFRAVYYPAVTVIHRVAGSEFSLRALCRRAFRQGRGEVALYGVHRDRLLRRGQDLWCAVALVDFAWAALRFSAGWLMPDPRFRAALVLRAAVRFGKLYQSCIALSSERLRHNL